MMAAKLSERIRPDVEAAPWVCDEVRRLEQQRDQLLTALHHISLCSQNSMSSQRECGNIARAAIAKATGSTS